MRSKYIFLQVIFLFFSVSLKSQMVTLDPVSAGAGDMATIIFDAAQGNKELLGATKVYIHHGVVTDKPDGTAWKYVKGNWGKDDGVGLMTKVAGEANKWKFTFSPTIRQYFNVPGTENIYRISCVFRNADGTKKGTMPAGQYGWGTVSSNSDIFINLNSGDFVQINQPGGEFGLYNESQTFSINASASSEVTQMTLYLDEGNGLEAKAEVSSGKTITYSYEVNTSKTISIRVVAIINGVEVIGQKNYDVVVKKPTISESRPAGTIQGANYFQDPTKARLCLLAPDKDFVYVVGDFTNWKINENYQMKRDGEHYWLDINGLEPGKAYVYQYWIDGVLMVADPYTHQVADPWNDKWIEPSVFPGLPAYSREDLGIASVLQTNQQDYTWSSNENTWKRPDVNHLVIYELHVRDFLASHSFQDLKDTLSYLKRLGINAIELMPVNEFEGNDSWGYNPSFYFAADKYYGTKNDLKALIDAAHQHGMAVIMDIVLNHSFGQSPMVQMYFDKSANKPTANNPWFYRNYVGPYEWGYDFNHDSPYTKQFVDDVNTFWMREFHFDGFRFDFTKGFTSAAFSFDGYNPSRISILKRMADKIWEEDDEAYVILEHWGVSNEEKELGDYGMKMWANRSYDMVPATVGNPLTGSFSNMFVSSHVSLYNSHDERRLAEHCLTEGRSQDAYNIRIKEIMYERVKLAAAFAFLQPGPKMIWQFDELGYDIDINLNGRTGRKPLPWGNGSLKYYEDSLRQQIYTTYHAILSLRNTITPQKLASATKNHIYTGNVRKLSYEGSDFDLLVFGNFATTNQTTIPKFTQTGWWYNYFSGDSLFIQNVNQSFTLRPGEWQIWSSKRYSTGFPGAVEVFDNPVTISPYPFTLDDEITIRFDAKKASKKGSSGLIGAQKVYMHSGTILNPNNITQWNKTVGSLADDGIGLMTYIGDDIWEIKIKPRDYYGIPTELEVLQLGMYFRNEDNTRFGYGFRNSLIVADVKSSEPIVTVNPPAFEPNTPITITFHADRGNRELLNATKIYLHSGVSKVNNNTPQINGWQHVVGNWGQDDGVGRMTKVNGTNRWQITLTPKTYYNLEDQDFPYWITAVFRNAEGSIKGTGPVGPMSNGFIDNNLDFFIKNAFTVKVQDAWESSIIIFPNPVVDLLQVSGLQNKNFDVRILDVTGMPVSLEYLHDINQIPVNHLIPGPYFLEIKTAKSTVYKAFIKM